MQDTENGGRSRVGRFKREVALCPSTGICERLALALFCLRWSGVVVELSASGYGEMTKQT